MTANSTTHNLFAKQDGIEDLIGTAIGAATSPMLWLSEDDQPAVQDRNGKPCVFDSVGASEIVEHAIARLSQIMGGH